MFSYPRTRTLNGSESEARRSPLMGSDAEGVMSYKSVAQSAPLIHYATKTALGEVPAGAKSATPAKSLIRL